MIIKIMGRKGERFIRVIACKDERFIKIKGEYNIMVGENQDIKNEEKIIRIGKEEMEVIERLKEAKRKINEIYDIINEYTDFMVLYKYRYLSDLDKKEIYKIGIKEVDKEKYSKAEEYIYNHEPGAIFAEKIRPVLKKLKEEGIIKKYDIDLYDEEDRSYYYYEIYNVVEIRLYLDDKYKNVEELFKITGALGYYDEWDRSFEFEYWFLAEQTNWYEHTDEEKYIEEYESKVYYYDEGPLGFIL